MCQHALPERLATRDKKSTRRGGAKSQTFHACTVTNVSRETRFRLGAAPHPPAGSFARCSRSRSHARFVTSWRWYAARRFGSSP